MKGAALFLMLAASLEAQVPFDRIRHADSEPQSWLTYSGNYSGHRFSRLNQITAANVGQLKPVWAYQVGNQAEFETSPIVADGGHTGEAEGMIAGAARA